MKPWLFAAADVDRAYVAVCHAREMIKEEQDRKPYMQDLDRCADALLGAQSKLLKKHEQLKRDGPQEGVQRR